MIVRNKIWDEIVHADANRICACRYANVQRRITLGYKIAIPLLSGICACAIKLDSTNAAFWSSIVLCVSTVIKSIFPQVILPENKIQELNELQLAFIDYRTACETLLHQFDHRQIEEKDTLKELQTLQKKISTKVSELDALVIWIPRYIDDQITKESEQYLNAIHNNQYE